MKCYMSRALPSVTTLTSRGLAEPLETAHHDAGHPGSGRLPFRRELHEQLLQRNGSNRALRERRSLDLNQAGAGGWLGLRASQVRMADSQCSHEFAIYRDALRSR